jgi:inorganic triphosphatase YgiF
MVLASEVWRIPLQNLEMEIALDLGALQNPNES